MQMNGKSTLCGLAFMAGLAASALIGPAVHAADLEALIRHLGGDDEAKRVLARQLLPREGLDAVPPLLELMEHENPEIWRAAKNVLSDIGHSVGTPGFETERRRFTSQLMDVARSDAPGWTVKHAIRLLGIVAPEGYSIKPLRDLALDPKWREETLGALEIMGTSESRKLLEKLSRIGSVEERVEVIELLRLVSGNVSATLLLDSDPRIRVAAMRALAPRGARQSVTPFEQAMTGIEGALYVEAVDAYLNLAEAIVTKEGNQQEGTDMFRRLLTTQKATAFRGAALAGLGRYGDESVVTTIIDATKEEEGRDLEAPALMALGHLRGHAAYSAMLEAYPGVGEEMQLGLLGVFGRTQAPMFREVLETAAKNSRTSTQAAARQALKQFELPPGIDTAEASHPPKRDVSNE